MLRLTTTRRCRISCHYQVIVRIRMIVIIPSIEKLLRNKMVHLIIIVIPTTVLLLIVFPSRVLLIDRVVWGMCAKELNHGVLSHALPRLIHLSVQVDARIWQLLLRLQALVTFVVWNTTLLLFLLWPLIDWSLYLLWSLINGLQVIINLFIVKVMQ